MTQRIWDTLTPFVVSGLVLPTGEARAEWRAPHHVSFCVRGRHRRDLLPRFEAEGVVLSGGSACSTDSALPSHVLAACRVPPHFIHGSVRITLSHTNRMEEVESRICPALERVLRTLSQ